MRAGVWSLTLLDRKTEVGMAQSGKWRTLGLFTRFHPSLLGRLAINDREGHGLQRIQANVFCTQALASLESQPSAPGWCFALLLLPPCSHHYSPSPIPPPQPPSTPVLCRRGGGGGVPTAFSPTFYFTSTDLQMNIPTPSWPSILSFVQCSGAIHVLCPFPGPPFMGQALTKSVTQEGSWVSLLCQWEDQGSQGELSELSLHPGPFSIRPGQDSVLCWNSGSIYGHSCIFLKGSLECSL